MTAVVHGMRFRMCALWCALMLSAGGVMVAEARDEHAQQRRLMVDDIVRMTRDTRHETGRAVLAQRTLAAMASVPRHLFVTAGQERDAYRNRPLAIDLGQTISQPFIVALMTDLLEISPGHRVLEIGTGSGYQAAVLAQLGAAVYTVEILEPLSLEAQRRLRAAGYGGVMVRTGDGHQGWAEHAPFDAIMVTAAAPRLPPALIEQLKPGGRLVIPIGPQAGVQTLYAMDKKADGTVTQRAVLAVRFVPLTGGSGH
jgi:protein-L-isoaspartate(D-aspartate) O-methyltransferase